MPRIFPLKPSFNGGELGPRLAAREDFSKFEAAAEVLENFLPLIQGGIMYRPGTRHVSAESAAARIRLLPFIFGVSAAYVIGAAPLTFRWFTNRARLMAETVDATITNGDFAADITGWTDKSGAGASIAHDATHGRLSLVGAAGQNAAAEQSVATTALGVEHTLRWRSFGGPVKLRIGTTSGGGEIVEGVTLGAGNHLYSFTPNASPFYVQFVNEAKKALTRQIDDVEILSGMPLELPTPYASVDEIRELQLAQSADVLYLAHRNYAPRKLERRSERSWSLVEISFIDGPYLPENNGQVTITPSATTGSVTLTATGPVWTAEHVGALWRLKHSGVRKAANLTSADTYTGSIKVEGAGSERTYTVTLAGTWAGKVTLQRSYDGGSTWVDYRTFTANTTTNVSDGLSQTVHYRLGFKTGDYTSGTAEASLFYEGGETWGYARITGYTSSTSVTAEVLEDFAAAEATRAWREGEFSPKRGYPGAVTFYQGRLVWGGTIESPQTIWGSASGDYENHTPGVDDGDAFEFTIASNEVNTIRSLISSQHLVVMTSAGEWIVRSNSMDEPLTPSNVQVRQQTSRGSSGLQPTVIDRAILYIQRVRRKMFELIYDLSTDGYASNDMTEIAEHIAGRDGFVETAYAREPESRLYCVRGDGQVAVLTYRREQEVFAWNRLVMRLRVESVAVIPGETQDEVWFSVTGEIDGSPVRHVVVMEDEDFGDDASDAFFVDDGITYEGAATTTITGLDHIEGELVRINANGATYPEQVVTGGQVTIPHPHAKVHVGLPYDGLYKSLRLVGGNPAGTAIGAKKRVWKLLLILLESMGGVAGCDPDRLTPIRYKRPVGVPPPLYTGQKEVDPSGQTDDDPRIYIRQAEPQPFTVLAMVPQTTVHPK